MITFHIPEREELVLIIFIQGQSSGTIQRISNLIFLLAVTIDLVKI